MRMGGGRWEVEEKEKKLKEQKRGAAYCYMQMVCKWCENCALGSSKHGWDKWPTTDPLTTYLMDYIST